MVSLSIKINFSTATKLLNRNQKESISKIETRKSKYSNQFS